MRAMPFRIIRISMVGAGNQLHVEATRKSVQQPLITYMDFFFNPTEKDIDTNSVTFDEFNPFVHIHYG